MGQGGTYGWFDLAGLDLAGLDNAGLDNALDWIMLIGYIEPDWFSLDRIGLPARPYLFNQQPT